LVTLPKNFWSIVQGSVVIQLYAGECTPSVDRALMLSVKSREAAELFLKSLVCLYWKSNPVYHASQANALTTRLRSWQDFSWTAVWHITNAWRSKHQYTAQWSI